MEVLEISSFVCFDLSGKLKWKKERSTEATTPRSPTSLYCCFTLLSVLAVDSAIAFKIIDSVYKEKQGNMEPPTPSSKPSYSGPS